MRILLVNSFYYPRGGDCIHLLALERLLRDAGHEVAVFAMQHPDNLPSSWSTYWPRQVEYRGALGVWDQAAAAVRSVYAPSVAHSLAAQLRDFTPDVVHLHSIHHHLTLSVLDEAKRHGLPLVWTLHDYRTVCPATHLLRRGLPCELCAEGAFWHCIAGRCKSDSLARSLTATFEAYLTRLRRSLALVDCYVAPSEFLAETVTRMQLPARRIVVVPNFLARTDHPRAASEPGDPQSADDEPAREGLLYVGRLSPEKGVDCLLDACKEIDAPLTIVGDGPSMDELRTHAMRIGARARFAGWLDERAVRAAMREASLLCAPSVWYENCPVTALEAMAEGLPIVASDIGGLPELLDQGRCGWLAAPGDSRAWRRVLLEALKDAPKRAAFSAKARERLAQRHDPGRYVEAIQDVYESVV